MDMRFGLRNIRSFFRASSLMTVSRELSKYKLDLVGVQEVRWEGGVTEPEGEYTFFYRNDNENHELGTGFFVHQRNKIRFPNTVLGHYTQGDNIHEI
jgi:hypothetical protein